MLEKTEIQAFYFSIRIHRQLENKRLWLAYMNNFNQVTAMKMNSTARNGEFVLGQSYQEYFDLNTIALTGKEEVGNRTDLKLQN